MPRVRDGLRNPGWKLLSVLLAYLFWLAVISERQAIRQIDVPVRFEHLHDSLALLREGPSTVVVRVQGADPLIKALDPPDLEAHLDLSGLGVGTHLIRLSPDGPQVVVKKPGLKVTEVYPSALEVRLEPKASALVPVKVTLVGAPAPGYEVSEQRVEPPRVRVEGPQSAVQAIAEARTREISIAGRSSAVKQTAWLEVAHPGVALVGRDRVEVTIDIREATAERTFAAIPVAPVGTAYETRIIPRQVRVTVRGPEALLTGLSREDLVVFVDLEGLAPRALDYRREVRCAFNRDALRDRVKVVEISEPEVAVHVYGKKSPPPAEGNPRGG